MLPVCYPGRLWKVGFDSWRIAYDASFSLDRVCVPIVLLVCMKVKPSRIPQGKVMLQLAIDPDLRRKFKARCVEEGKTMSQKLEEMIYAWLK